MNCARTPL